MRSRIAGVLQGVIVGVVLSAAAALSVAALAFGAWVVLHGLRSVVA